MKFRATFIGENSLGYEKGKTYDLLMIGPLTISRIDGTGICPYGSVLAFIKNWENLNSFEK